MRPDDHTAVLKVWSKRHRDLGRLRNQVACRLHAVLCELVPGGVRKEITAAHAARILEAAEPSGAVALARWELAGDFLEDLRRLDAQMSQTKKKLAAAVKASGTTLTEVFGVGPVIAAIVLGEVEDVSRFRDRDHFAAYNGTAPIEVSSGKRKVHRLSRRGNRRRQPRGPHGRDHPDPAPRTARAAPTTTRRSPRARPRKKPCAPSSGASATPSTGGCAPTPAALPAQPRRSRAREGKRGTTLTPARPDRTPNPGSSAKPLPGPSPHYAPPPAQPKKPSSRASKKMPRTP